MVVRTVTLRTAATIVGLTILAMTACWLMPALPEGSQIGLDPNGGRVGDPFPVDTMGDYWTMAVAVAAVFLICKIGGNEAAESVKEEKEEK